MLLSIGGVLVGVALLAYAADQFVLGSASLARLLRVPAVVVGVVIVGFGTSTPELLVSTLSAVQGSPDVAAGNILGSNIVNVTLLLGVGALIIPLVVESGVVRREAPLALIATIGYGLAIQRPERLWGVVLVVAMVLVVGHLLRMALRSRAVDPVGGDVDDLVTPLGSRRVEIVRTVLGLAGTIIGAQLLLGGALDLADRAGLSEGFVGATMVAVGTSLPELVTVVQSARRRETDLILGNLLGSNLFNAFFVGGVSMTVSDAAIGDASLRLVAAPLAAGVGALVWWYLNTGRRVSRAEAMTLIAIYAVIVPLLA